MFGGGTRYVDTLDRILEYVDAHHPSIENLADWHRGAFANVSSQDSIMRRVGYLQHVGFLRQANEHWELGAAAREYVEHDEMATLLRIMCNRNVGLRSLLYVLSSRHRVTCSDGPLSTVQENGSRFQRSS
jgi:putative restriction endonuclease